MEHGWRTFVRHAVGMCLGLLAGLLGSPSNGSDTTFIFCPALGPCPYESPAFSVRVVDGSTGEPIAEAHALAVWLAYGTYGGRGPLMALEAVSGPDGILSFTGWGPLPGPTSGLEPGRDPLISVFRPGYRALLIHNATPLGQPDTARVRTFQQAGRTFGLTPFQGTPAESVAELQRAAYPELRMGPSQHDPAAIRRVYVSRWQRVRAEAERLPRKRDVEQLLMRLEDEIRFFGAGG